MHRKFSVEGDLNLTTVDSAGNFTEWAYSEISGYIRGNVLEIGSGIGTYSRKIIRDNPDSEIILSEIDSRYVRTLKENFRGRNISVTDIDITKKDDFKRVKVPLDTIFASNVLEHIKDDVAALNNIHEKLNEKGRCVLIVPAYPSLYNSLDAGAEHFRRYTERSMMKKVEKTGFSVIHMSMFNVFSIPGWVVNGNILRRQTLSEGMTSCFDRLVPVFRQFEKHILRNNFGISLRVVLEK